MARQRQSCTYLGSWFLFPGVPQTDTAILGGGEKHGALGGVCTHTVHSITVG